MATDLGSRLAMEPPACCMSHGMWVIAAWVLLPDEATDLAVRTFLSREFGTQGIRSAREELFCDFRSSNKRVYRASRTRLYPASRVAEKQGQAWSGIWFGEYPFPCIALYVPCRQGDSTGP